MISLHARLLILAHLGSRRCCECLACVFYRSNVGDAVKILISVGLWPLVILDSYCSDDIGNDSNRFTINDSGSLNLVTREFFSHAFLGDDRSLSLSR